MPVLFDKWLLATCRAAKKSRAELNPPAFGGLGYFDANGYGLWGQIDITNDSAGPA